MELNKEKNNYNKQLQDTILAYKEKTEIQKSIDYVASLLGGIPNFKLNNLSIGESVSIKAFKESTRKNGNTYLLLSIDGKLFYADDYNREVISIGKHN